MSRQIITASVLVLSLAMSACLAISGCKAPFCFQCFKNSA